MNEITYKSGFVAVMGKPNVGKSTLVNALVGQKIAAVTPRPQTTRKRQMGILSQENAQVIFIDTPGVHNPRHKLGEKMNKEALDTLEDSDLVLFLVDLSQPPDDEDALLASSLEKLRRRTPVLLVLNKADLLKEERQARIDQYLSLVPPRDSTRDSHLVVSAIQHEGLEQVVAAILERLSEGAPFFPEGQVTDLFERDLAADLIREAALIHLRDEVPHGIAVRIDTFQERDESGAYIEATLIVEKESHKPIVIGQKGEMMKRIGSAARMEIERATGRKVFLKLLVKVRKNWRDDEKALRGFGY